MKSVFVFNTADILGLVLLIGFALVFLFGYIALKVTEWAARLRRWVRGGK